MGERITVLIEAHRYWTDTGLSAVAGAVYECRAEGRWWDLGIPCGPDGYETPWWSFGQRLTSRCRRLPAARWFALCGAVDSELSSPFLIGSTARLRLSAGRLWCFANDVPGFYWNNFGAVTLTIERTA